MPSSAADGQALPALTGLRAFAALAVVAWHLRELAYLTLPATAVIKPLLDAGLLGVDVFFVLSGFLLSHRYAERLRRCAPAARRDYLWARVARVYPVHVVTLFGVAALAGLAALRGGDLDPSVEYTPLGFVGNLLMLQALPGVPAWNVPAWSISCEFAAYLLFPFLAGLVLRVRPVLAALLAATVLLAQTVALLVVASSPDAVLACYWLLIAGEFTAGVLVWRWWQHRPRQAVGGDLVAVAAVLAAAGMLWSGLPWLFVAPLCAVLVPALATATGPIRSMLASRPVQWLGRASYALYLVHYPVIVAGMLWVLPADPGATAGAWFLVGAVTVSIALAALVHHGVEEPARRRLSSWLRSRRAPHAADERSSDVGGQVSSAGV